MAFGSKVAPTSVYVGSTSELVVLAEAKSDGDKRFLRSLDISGSTSLDKFPTLGAEDIEVIVNQYSTTISAAVIYGEEPKKLRAIQDNTDNIFVIIARDSETCYILPITWTGQPIDNPTNALITVNMEFLQAGNNVDGGPVSGKTRVKRFTDIAGGTTSTGFASVDAGDKVYLVVTDFEGTAETFTLTNPSSTEISDDVSVSRTGIYEVPVKDGQTFGDLMQLKYSGTSSDKISGWFIAGPLATID